MTLQQDKADLSLGTSYPWIDDVYRIYNKRRRQPRIVRLVAVLFFVSIAYLVVTHSTSPASWGRKEGLDALTDETTQEAEELGIYTASVLETRPDEKSEESVLFEANIKHLLEKVPDEIHVKEMLRPIVGNGPERLQDTGARARAFSNLYESWEKLHVVLTENSTFVRDDVIPYLRRVKDLSAISATKSRAEIIRVYERYRSFMTKFSALLFPWTAPYFADHMTLRASLRQGERGIVLFGGEGHAAFMHTSVETIRKLGCNLPIEIMYLGEADLSEVERSVLEELPGVVTRDIRGMVNDQGWPLVGWSGKPFAILLSSFREVLYIDADSFFFQNPETLFYDPDYVETGALFFRDRLMFPESKKKWLTQILPRPVSDHARKSRLWTGESSHMQESGVIVVDKWRHFMALLMVTRMNGPDRDGDKEKGIVGTYDMVYGDKETYWLGWELVGDNDYSFHPGDAGSMGVARADRGESPKIAATADQIAKKFGKNAGLGALAGSYDATFHMDNLALAEESQSDEDISADTSQPDETAVEEDRTGSDEAEEETEKSGELQDVDEEEVIEAPDYDNLDPESLEEAAEDDPAETLPEQLRKRTNARAHHQALHKHMGKGKGKGGKTKQKAAKTDEIDSEAALAYAQAEKLETEDADVDDEHLVPPVPKGQPVPEPDQMGTNYTICAPQLLHLDREGRPLWFNGWILDRKSDLVHAEIAKFSVFMKEKRADDSNGSWMLQSNNMCCLQSDILYRFTKQEKEALQTIVDTAKEVGALGKTYFPHRSDDLGRGQTG